MAETTTVHDIALGIYTRFAAANANNAQSARKLAETAYVFAEAFVAVRSQLERPGGKTPPA